MSVRTCEMLDTLDLLWSLAQHHREILERRFPNYKYTIFDPVTAELKVFLRVDILDKPDHLPPERERPFQHRYVPYDEEPDRIFLAVFSPSFIYIMPGDFDDDSDLNVYSREDDKVYYADPKFTDNILSDKMKEFERDKTDGTPH